MSSFVTAHITSYLPSIVILCLVFPGYGELLVTDYFLDRFFWTTGFVFIFPNFFVSVPCARLRWPSRQLLNARQSTVSPNIIKIIFSLPIRVFGAGVGCDCIGISPKLFSVRKLYSTMVPSWTSACVRQTDRQTDRSWAALICVMHVQKRVHTDPAGENCNTYIHTYIRVFFVQRI